MSNKVIITYQNTSFLWRSTPRNRLQGSSFKEATSNNRLQGIVSKESTPRNRPRGIDSKESTPKNRIQRIDLRNASTHSVQLLRQLLQAKKTKKLKN